LFLHFLIYRKTGHRIETRLFGQFGKGLSGEPPEVCPIQHLQKFDK